MGDLLLSLVCQLDTHAALFSWAHTCAGDVEGGSLSRLKLHLAAAAERGPQCRSTHAQCTRSCCTLSCCHARCKGPHGPACNQISHACMPCFMWGIMQAEGDPEAAAAKAEGAAAAAPAEGEELDLDLDFAKKK